MKIYLINGSPRKNMNTAKLIESAKKGVESEGAEAEIIHLYDFCYKGCVNCFACKRIGNKTHGLCDYRDELRPILEKMQEADAIIIGAPIYFGYMNAQTRAFLERLIFPVHTYLVDKWTGKRIKIVKKIKPTGLIFSMNNSEWTVRNISQYSSMILNGHILEREFGYNEMIFAYDTVQFENYENYDVNEFDENDKLKYHDEHFPKDLKNAEELGHHMVQKVRELENF